MEETLPCVYLVRHGETAWSLSRQHTGTTDLPLIEKGEADALKVGRALENQTFAKVFSSPRQRALRTCELAGFGHAVEIDPDLAEWNYGDYEGLTTKEIHLTDPKWDLFHDGCPNGESPEEITARADRVIKRLMLIKNHVLIFSHGHFLRVLATRWIQLPVASAAHFLLETSSLSILGFEHSLAKPVISLWNFTKD
jgi:broad specificity phosphatase PhoE